MANYYAKSVSNWFKCKDVESLREIMEEYYFNDDYEIDEDNGKISIRGNCDLSCAYDYEKEEDVDILNIYQKFIADDSFMILNVIGSEKLRYVDWFGVCISKDSIKHYSSYDFYNNCYNNYNKFEDDDAKRFRAMALSLYLKMSPIIGDNYFIKHLICISNKGVKHKSNNEIKFEIKEDINNEVDFKLFKKFTKVLKNDEYVMVIKLSYTGYDKWIILFEFGDKSKLRNYEKGIKIMKDKIKNNKKLNIKGLKHIVKTL